MKAILLILLLSNAFVSIGQSANNNQYIFEVSVVDAVSEEKLAKVKIKVIGSDSSQYEFRTDSSGKFQGYLKRNEIYYIEVSSPGYLNAKGIETGSHGGGKVIHSYELVKLEQCGGLAPLISYGSNRIDQPYDPSIPDYFVLDYFHSILKDNPTIKVELIGFRDSTEANSISLERAVNAKDWLASNEIDSSRIQMADGGVAMKPTDYIRNSNQNSTEIEHNRLLIFKIIE